MSGEVGVVVLNFNRGSETTTCLESILRSDPRPNPVVVCDNCSSDDSWQELRQWCRKVSGRGPVIRSQPDCRIWGADSCLEFITECGVRILLMRTPENLGFAGGNNVGLRYLLNETVVRFLWLLNNDTRVEADTVLHLIDALNATPGSGMACSTVRYDRPPGLVQAYGGGRYYPWLGSTRLNGNGQPYDPEEAEARKSERRDFPLGASMLVCRTFVDDVGLLDDRFFLYFEELDWVLRAKGRFIMTYAPRSIVWHQEGASIGASQNALQEKSFFGDFHFQRSRLLLSRKHYPFYFPLVVASLFVTVCKRIVRRQPERILMLWRCLQEACRVRI